MPVIRIEDNMVKKLPPLEKPLNYPECLDRIVLAAEYRAEFLIKKSHFLSILETALSKQYQYIGGPKYGRFIQHREHENGIS